MTLMRFAFGFGLWVVTAISAAADVPSRSLLLEPLRHVTPLIGTFPAPDVTITRVEVVVPRSLRVVEIDSARPFGDIVWREEPAGDRYQQVSAIVQEAMERGVAGLSGPNTAALQVRVVRFQTLSGRLDATADARHRITFDMQLVDRASGTQLTDLDRIEVEISPQTLTPLATPAAFGTAAPGQVGGERAHITAHLAQVVRQVLQTPDAYRAARFVQLRTQSGL